MGFFDQGIGGGASGLFSDPATLAALGAMAGAFQSTGASRLPVSNGQVIGNAIQGGIGGAQAGQAMGLNEEQLKALKMQNAIAGWKQSILQDETGNALGGATVTPQTAPQPQGGASSGVSGGAAPSGIPASVDTSQPGWFLRTKNQPAIQAAQAPQGAAPDTAGQGRSNTFLGMKTPAGMTPRDAAKAWILNPGGYNAAMAKEYSGPGEVEQLIQDQQRHQPGSPAYNAIGNVLRIKQQQNVRPGGTVMDAQGNVVAHAPQIPPNHQLVQGPNGLQVTPITGAEEAATTNAMIPKKAEYQYEFGTPMPGTAVPRAPVQSAPLAAPAPQGGAGQPQEAGASEASPTTQAGPLAGAKSFSSAGRVLPPVSEQAPIEKGAAYLKEALPTWAKTEAEWAKFLQPAQAAETQLKAIGDAFKSVEGGTFTTQKAQINATFKALGLPEITDSDPAKVQIILKNNALATLNILKSATSRFTQMEFDRISKALANPDLQPAAALEIISESLGQARYGSALVHDWSDAKRLGWRNPTDFEGAWTKANPMQGFIDDARKEIGPLKGMPGGPVALPKGVPTGSRLIGATGGNPVYEVPDGQGGFKRQMLVQ